MAHLVSEFDAYSWPELSEMALWSDILHDQGETSRRKKEWRGAKMRIESQLSLSQ